MDTASATSHGCKLRKRKSRKILVFPGVDKDFSIDEDDYLVVRELVSEEGTWDHRLERQQPEACVQRIVDIRENDEERRVFKIEIQMTPSLPTSAARLENLTHLDISYTKNLTELPKDIGILVGLINLNLSSADIKSLPASIGELRNLKDLDLSSSNIKLLPPAIGKLQNLKDLNLSRTRKLSKLPKEIGNLASLNKLDLSYSGIKSLPPSIGRLQNLKHLDLSYTQKLWSKLPEEIGNLALLKMLNLSGAGITALPRFIGRLKKLEHLDLSSCVFWALLPEEIGDLASLVKLDLSWSNIGQLPPSIGRLQKLEHLNILKSHMSQSEEYLLSLVHRVRSLESICSDQGCTYETICYALAFNRYRSKTGFGISDKKSTPTSSKLWPLMLNNATRAFIPNTNIPFYEPCGWFLQSYIIPKPDAIYQFLLDGRESFVGLLVDRQSLRCNREGGDST